MPAKVEAIDFPQISSHTGPSVDRPDKAVVVHSGARDSYQLALALHEAGLLDTLVTDLFWPSDSVRWAALERALPKPLRDLVRRRSTRGLPWRKIRQCTLTGLRCLLLDRVPHVPFSTLRSSCRAADATLGRVAGKRARSSGAGLVTYSYYGYDAIRTYRRPSMLFQVHPHPATVRRLLRAELMAHPDCAASLLQEWELALPEDDYLRLVEEPKMASCLLVASSFTRQSLVENGVAAEAITVVPYGVDLQMFHADPNQTRHRDGPLKLLFVGRINQRKGIKYLLEALRLFPAHQVQLTVCGKVVDDLAIFRPFGDQVTVRPSVSSAALVEAYQTADLFVFPSVAEGFGQVLLEALACGLPIVSTTHTAAPDLIDDGRQGFIVEPCRSDLLAERIHWAIEHRSDLAAMRYEARIRAEQFTWQRFRMHAAEAVRAYMATRATRSDA